MTVELEINFFSPQAAKSQNEQTDQAFTMAKQNSQINKLKN